MKPDSTSPPSPDGDFAPQSPSAPSDPGVWIATVALALLWAQFLWFLRYNWSPDSYYNYGWLVPPFAILIFFAQTEVSPSKRDQAPSPRLSTLATLILPATLLGFLIARILIEANPFWRLPLWLGGLSLALASLSISYLIGGYALARRALFPLLFTLTMIPWPRGFEAAVVDVFTEIVKIVSVGSLQMLGYPAEKFGNIIQIGDISVGIEEACSGIKSLQGLSMLALFVGAYWRLKLSGRILLVFAAFTLTTVFNLARSLTLSLIVLNGGTNAFDEWHDTLGYLAFGLGFATLFLIANKQPSSPAPVPSSHKLTRKNIPRFTLATLAVFSLAPAIATHLWYSNAKTTEPSVDWTVDVQGAATEKLFLNELPIHPRIEDALGFDYGYHFSVANPERGVSAEVWHYGFHEDSKGKSLSAYGHSPLFCMTAAGATVLQKNEPLRVDLGPLAIPFQHYVFKLANGQNSQVFWCLWDDLFHGETSEVSDKFRLSQILAVFERQSRLRRKVVLLAIPIDDSSAARTEVKSIIRELFLLQSEGKTFRFH